MLARFLALSLSCLALLSGCDSGLNDPSDFPNEDFRARLENEGADTLSILPNGTAQLSVLYLDESGDPLEGVPVEFALVEMAAGSSLTPSSPLTDANGRARTTLRVGSQPSSTGFKVRVSAEGAAPLYLEIQVGSVAEVTIEVAVQYDGARDIASYSISRLASIGCEDALASGLPGDLTFSFASRDETQRFPLGPGLHYALVAWGRDATNARLAVGCAELDAPITSDDDEASQKLSVQLRDLPMKLAGGYDLTLDLDVSVSAQRAAAKLVESVRSALPASNTPEADAYLNALSSELSSDAREQLAELRATAWLTELQTALAESGLVARAEALAGAMVAHGSRLQLRTVYGYAVDLPGTLKVRMMRARTSDGTSNIHFGDMDPLLPLATIDASYSDTFAELRIATLSLELGLGRYASALVEELLTRPELALDTDPGCALLERAVREDDVLSEACDAACVVSACTRALAQSRAPILAGLASLDASHANIGLRGGVPVHDREQDGLVNDLGPATLDGNWGRADAVDGPDTVIAKVPAPSPAAMP